MNCHRFGSPIPRFRSHLKFRHLVADLMDAGLSGRRNSVHIGQFEKRLATTLEIKHCLAVDSVRAGICATLHALNIPDGSEILCSPISISPVFESLEGAGYHPVFVDYLPASNDLDLRHAEALISPKTRAILYTHLWSNPVKMEAIVLFCHEHNLFLLEDASQALNSRIDGRTAGSFGEAGFFSFSPSKTISTYHGAAVVTNNTELFSRIRSARSIKHISRLHIVIYIGAELLLFVVFHPWVFFLTGSLINMLEGNNKKGSTSRQKKTAPRRPLLKPMNALQAKRGLQQLETLHDRDMLRALNAAKIRDAIRNSAHIGAPGSRTNHRSNRWVFCIHSDLRNDLKKYLWTHWKIDSNVPRLASQLENPDSQAALLLNTALYLPIHENLSKRHINRIQKALRLFKANGGFSI